MYIVVPFDMPTLTSDVNEAYFHFSITGSLWIPPLQASSRKLLGTSLWEWTSINSTLTMVSTALNDIQGRFYGTEIHMVQTESFCGLIN